MFTLASILPQLIDIVSLYSNIRLECEKFRNGNIDENELIQSTGETKKRLVIKTNELVRTIEILGKSDEDLTRECSNLSQKIDNQAGRISHWLQPSLDINQVMSGISEIESNTSLLGKALCSHYDRMAANFEKEKILADCHAKVFQSIWNHPVPVFETEIEEYSEVIDGISVSYPESDDERFSLNRRILQFPGVFNFIMSLERAEKRNHLLRLIKEYDENNPSAIYPFPNEIVGLLPCIGVLDLPFSSEEDLRRDFIRFFRDGNWLEAYVYFMLDRAGCSTRLLNVNLSYKDILLEADVLALFRNRFFIFEMKDRGESDDGLTRNDLSDIEKQLAKIAKLADVPIIYVINVKEEQQESIRSQIEETASAKGGSVEILFLRNSGIDNLVAKIRSSLR